MVGRYSKKYIITLLSLLILMFSNVTIALATDGPTGTYTITQINQFNSGLSVTINNLTNANYFNAYRISNDSNVNSTPKAIAQSLNAMPAVYQDINNLTVRIYKDMAGNAMIAEFTLSGSTSSGILIPKQKTSTAAATTPVANPSEGGVAVGTQVSLSTDNEGANIYYTTDGTIPTAASTLYTGPIVVNEPTTIKAIATNTGMDNSAVMTVVYTIKTDECFIATAAYGSKLDPSVVLLRSFRDKFLLTNVPGQAFVNFYYKNSPPIASYISHNEPLKMIVRILLLPFISIAYLFFHPMIGIACASILIFFIFRRKSRSNDLGSVALEKDVLLN